MSKNTIKTLARAPKIINLNPTGRRWMVAVKNKRRVAQFMDENEVKPSELSTIYPKEITTSTLRGWLKDYRSGLYAYGNAVAVSRR